ncbi:MAG: hypothetical protein C0518_00850 [Opitutus sp.]|nr:hypothetical protein [Opitutus sp.]
MIPHTSCTPRAAYSRLLGASLAALLAFPAGLFAQTADATTKKDDTLQLQAFEVTGSRVKRMDTEGPAPVVTLSRGDLDLSGYMRAGLARLIASQLFGTSVFDPLAYGVVTFTLLTSALLACWIPARRATRVDPLVALRAE